MIHKFLRISKAFRAEVTVEWCDILLIIEIEERIPQVTHKHNDPVIERLEIPYSKGMRHES